MIIIELTSSSCGRRRRYFGEGEVLSGHKALDMREHQGWPVQSSQ